MTSRETPPKRTTALTQEIKEWVGQTRGYFTSRECDRELELFSKTDKDTRRKVINRMVQEETLQAHPERAGVYRKHNKDMRKMDLLKPVTKGTKLILPLGVHELCRIYPGNIIIVAGERNAGKTAYLLNLVADNLTQWQIHYFNSEMGDEELIMRLRSFDNVDFNDFVKYANFYERAEDFHEVIVPGSGNLNVIDFMEIHENHFKIGSWIKEIHSRLDGAIAVIGIQKAMGRDIGVGGEVTTEKPRIYLAMSPGKMKIVKAKNFVDSYTNPNGMTITFKLIGGAEFKKTDSWHIDDDRVEDM